MYKSNDNKNLRDIILGMQDGLVNVLGIVLGVGAATNDQRLILISALAATFAESISMAAVAYTSTEASLKEYLSELVHPEGANTNHSQEEVAEVKSIIGTPVKSAVIVVFSSLVGSLIPVVPFAFAVPMETSMYLSVLFAALVLFVVGYFTSKRTSGSPLKSGVKLTLIGIVSALLGYLIGTILGKI